MSGSERPERDCPDCGGRQVVMGLGYGDPLRGTYLSYGKAWVCTDTECDRRDRYQGTGSDHP